MEEADAAGLGSPQDVKEPEESALQRFCADFTQRARDGDIDPVFGREEEIRRMVDILARRRKNNPIIVGDAGVGKTALVEGLALRIARGQDQGDVPEILRDVSIWGLDIGLLQAGAGVKGEFEKRLRSVINEIRSADESIILFIDEAHALIGAGGRQGGSDAANLLKPVLARGELRTIAATTWTEYKRYFEKDAALSRRFQPVPLTEPDTATTVRILRGLKKSYEDAHRVTIRDDAVVAAAELSARYISGRFLPDKAVDLLDTAAARVKVSLTAKPNALRDLEHETEDTRCEVEALRRDKANGLEINEAALEMALRKVVDLEEDAELLSARWKEERELVHELLALRGEQAQVRQGKQMGLSEKQLRVKILECLAALDKARYGQPLVRHEVDPDVVARVVSEWTGVPLGRMLRDELEQVGRLAETLARRIRGQTQALDIISRNIRAAKTGLRDPNLPLAAFLLVGPGGVGKTETALALAESLFGHEDSLVVINMSEFQEKHNVSRLIGSPPGYVGYGEGGLLTDAVRRQPYSLVLLDQADKAHPEIINLFYQVFDKGKLIDGEGRVVDFRHAILFMTCKMEAEAFAAAVEGAKPTPLHLAERLKPALADRFPAGLLARVVIVPYQPLGPSAMREIVLLKLDRLAQQLASNNNIQLAHTPAVADAIADRCSEASSGARTIDHILRASVLPRMSESILDCMVKGSKPRTMRLDMDHTGRLSVEFEQGADQNDDELE